jgi:thiol peroxidase
MASITHKGNPVTTCGNLPARGTKAPDFTLTKGDLSDVHLAAFAGKKKVLNIVPSLDTGTCATSARKFNDQVKGRTDVVVLTVSADLPFAQKRFCEANNIDNVITLSMMRDRKFGQDYGVALTSGVLAGVLSRAVVVLDEEGMVVYTQQVPEIGQEPDYDAVWKALG